jgi:PBP1b-binding outer membrane lipoprotein LpoB
MKKLFMIVVLGLTMTSCSNTPTEVKNSKESTTVELQQLASIDSVTYKVVEKGSTVYILSTKDNRYGRRNFIRKSNI